MLHTILLLSKNYVSLKSTKSNLIFFDHIFQSYNDYDLAVLVTSIGEMAYSFGVLFVLFEIGQRTRDAFEARESVLFEFDWYQFPLDIRQKLPSVWAVTQKPMILKVFGRSSCNRKSFRKVGLFDAIISGIQVDLIMA